MDRVRAVWFVLANQVNAVLFWFYRTIAIHRGFNMTEGGSDTEPLARLYRKKRLQHYSYLRSSPRLCGKSDRASQRVSQGGG